MKKVFCRAAYNYDMDEASNESGLKCDDPSLAQQHFRDECDINTIVERFNLTGQVPTIDKMPAYADYEGIFDFQSAMNTIRAAQEQFMTLPAKVRARFHNEPQEFLEFCADDNNLEEAQKLGLLKPKEPATIHPPVNPQGASHGPQTAASPAPSPQDQQGNHRTQAAESKNQGTQKP